MAASLWARAGRRRVASIVCTGLLGVMLAGAISAIRVPVPRIHDEFSYLLASDTFASGRLTNPTHPLWQHFETIHVNHVPSYASKYPPLQGGSLALGQLVGHPIIGSWLATGVLVAACCWMLQGFVPGRWALLGACAVALHHSIQFYWAQSYWGGALAMAGGALLFGGWVRLKRTPQRDAAVLLAFGIAMLANSRPFEGLVACVPVGVSLLHSIAIAGASNRRVWLRDVVAPVAVVLAVAGSAMAYYNLQVTGDPLEMPYQAHEAMYNDLPLFLWQERGPQPEYRHPAIRDFYEKWGHQWYQHQLNLASSIPLTAALIPFFLSPFLALSMLSLPWIVRSTEMRFVLATVALVFVAVLTIPYEPRSHYLSPVGSLLILLAVQGYRQMVQFGSVGRIAVWVLVAGHVLLFAAAGLGYSQLEIPAWSVERERIVERLEAEDGAHLVLVKYRADHNPHEEWVWNAADIDAAKVVWARTSIPGATGELRAYFAARRIWTLDADVRPAALVEWRDPIPTSPGPAVPGRGRGG